MERVVGMDCLQSIMWVRRDVTFQTVRQSSTSPWWQTVPGRCNRADCLQRAFVSRSASNFTTVRECAIYNLRILKVFENSRTFRNFKTWNEFKIFVHLFYFYFVNFLRLLQLVNVTSNQSDCLLKSHDVNRSTELLLTDQDTTVTTSTAVQSCVV